MIASVAGAWTRPRPPPRNNIDTTMMEYGVSTAAVVAAIANPPAIDTSPPVTTALVLDALGQLGGERCRRRREHGEGNGTDTGLQRAIRARTGSTA